MEIGKAFVGYAATAALTWMASRYHLSGDQVMMITTDVGAALAAAAGIYAHTAASKNGGNNDGH